MPAPSWRVWAGPLTTCRSLETLALRAARRSEQGRAHIIVTPGRLQETDPALAPLRRQSDGRIFILSALDLPAEPEERGPEEEAAV